MKSGAMGNLNKDNKEFFTHMKKRSILGALNIKNMKQVIEEN